MDKYKKTFVMNTLRRGTYRWRGRWMAEKRTHIGRNEYYCENPECGLVLPKKMTQMDHIIPVVPVTGWDSLDAVADRMYCEANGWQRLCKECHREKTNKENELRGEPRKSKKHAKKSLTKSKK